MCERYDVTRALRDNTQTKGIPIMAVTCLTKDEEVEKIRACGVDDYLAKPFKSEDLLAKVKALLGEKVEDA